MLSGVTVPAWLDEAADPADLRLDPAMAALLTLLEPVGRADAAATRLMPRIIQARELQQPPQPKPLPRSAVDIENERVQKMSSDEYSEHMRAKIDAERIGAAFTPASGILRG
jgi:hypothetical protein